MGQREDNREAAIDLFPGCKKATHRGSDSESNSVAHSVAHKRISADVQHSERSVLSLRRLFTKRKQ